jgi:RimJ/RimL family protein N-acetyltransferase
MSISTLTTQRLILERLRLADAPALQRLFPHWEIVRYLSSPAVPWPYPADGALVYCRDVALPAMARGEEWHWTLRLRETPDEIIGAIGLMNAASGNRGFWLAPPWQGRGLMTEACEASADFWFGVLGRSVLREPRASANHASVRIAAKTGMRLVAKETRRFVAGDLPAELWEISRAEWQARRKNPLGPRG